MHPSIVQKLVGQQARDPGKQAAAGSCARQARQVRHAVDGGSLTATPHHSVIADPPGRARGAVTRAGARMQQHAAAAPTLLCQREPDLFFSENPEDLRLAKALCGHCPVRSACLAGALQRGEPWGVWGGELFVQGVVVARKRPRGRPRKTEVMA